MDTIWPLAVALVLFPLSFFLPRLRSLGWAFAVPLAPALLFTAAVAFGAGPAYPNALFALIGFSLAWRWRATAASTARSRHAG
jgi:hypothetical protein